ncbi:DUF1302 domain-containing protein [Variovorax sp. J31P179]|uniref:DUF1302 domain-containing protein n=1 Tax=Variovorax sp. J31P179 TaxID=3053508 RepID=UPI0025787641|nr:DUF1302 domain-containing protein [Variovorax sp. J31P179]MDM0082892.1 DUF1302 domain-containing protein [Variovorax sp. J31P179]
MPHRVFRAPASIRRLSAVTTAALAPFAIVPASHAMEIDTGNPDVVLRWDNTLRYNLGQRTQSQDKAILGNPNFDDGDRNFNNHSLIANRLDLLSELDLVVDKKYGFRVSGTAWADPAYNNLDNRNNATANTLSFGVPTAGILSPYTSRYAKGPSGELLDAFVFGNTDIGETNVGLRLGKHTVYWGESLLGGGAVNGISYGQYSLDLWKALATPGIEAKELYRPRNSATLQVQPTAELSLSAQTFFDWESARYPESGSYLTVNDALLHGGESLIAGPGQRLLQATNSEPNKTGDFGLAARWSPEWLDGTAGLYGRRTADIQPQLALLPAVAAGVPAAACSRAGLRPVGPSTCYINPGAATLPQIQAGYVGQYQAFYGRDIDIYGVSLAKNVAGLSLGAELSYRRNMPLQSVPVQVLPAPLVNPATGAISLAQLSQLGGDTPGARGDTMHGVFNLLGTVSKTPLFDSATWNAELVWSHWLSVSQNPGAFKGSDAYRANPANVDAVSKDYFGLGLNFTPTWYQVYPGVDLSMPLSWSGGISGNSAVLTGGNKNAGSFGIGIAADVQSKYNFALRYVGFYGDYSTTPTGAMNVPNGTYASLSDRGHVLLTFKTTF